MMKLLKKIFTPLFIILLIISCEDSRDLDFIDTAALPAEISALYDITQDNTGLVTITPNALNTTSFEIYFGDGTEDPAAVLPGENIEHIYAEGTYTVRIVAFNVLGESTEISQQLVVSFQAPSNLVVVIENDANISKQVNVTVNADFATMFDFFTGDPATTDPVSANIGETASYLYPAAGTYSIRVVAKGAAIEVTEYTEDFEVTEILAPTDEATTPPVRNDTDVVSIFSDAYTNVTLDELPTDWSGIGAFEATTVGTNNVWKITAVDFMGIVTNYAAGIDLSQMEMMHIDYWVPQGQTNELLVKIVNTVDGGEDIESLGATVDGSWQSIDIPMTGFDGGDLANKEKITQLIIDSDGVSPVLYIDNFYFWKAPAAASGIEGIWQLAPEAGAFKVGPSPGSGAWFSNTAGDVTTRACFFDDKYVLSLNGDFQNVLDGDTWLEAWQTGAGDGCGAPIAPHDGSNPATYSYNAGAGTLTVNGTGSYMVLPKAVNAGELPNVAVPSSITYNVSLTSNNNEMELMIESGSGVWWTYKLIRYTSPVEGTWKLAPEAGAFKVGPSPGSGDWFSNSLADVTTRACFFDDDYVFNSDGSFQNVLGTETWLEGWQTGGGDMCGTPVAPHNGSNPATYSYDENTGELTLTGTGAYLVLPKAVNAGELPNVAVPSSVTYDITLANGNTEMTVVIESGSGVFWTYKLIK